jgi:hypothetical protein
MDDPLGVRRLERVGDLDPDVERRAEVEGAPADAFRERFPFEEFMAMKCCPSWWSIS